MPGWPRGNEPWRWPRLDRHSQIRCNRACIARRVCELFCFSGRVFPRCTMHPLSRLSRCRCRLQPGQWAVGSEWLGPAFALQRSFWSGFGLLGRFWPSELGELGRSVDTAPAEDWLPSPPSANPSCFAWLFASLPLPAGVCPCLPQSASGSRANAEHTAHSSLTWCIPVGRIPRRATTADDRRQNGGDGDGDGGRSSEHH